MFWLFYFLVASTQHNFQVGFDVFLGGEPKLMSNSRPVSAKYASFVIIPHFYRLKVFLISVGVVLVFN